MSSKMLQRFGLYGFLKSQRYMEPFLVLALCARGMSFLDIGVLMAIRHLSAAVLEIPSGALADTYGLRLTLAGSLVSYALGSALLGMADGMSFCIAAMIILAVGESFRTGAHKAMIANWLRSNDHLENQTRVFGHTRSWGKIGAALSAALAMVVVTVTNGFDLLFFLPAIPLVICILNILSYPSSVEPTIRSSRSFRSMVEVLLDRFRASVRIGPLRRLLSESMCFDSVLRVATDYLQPVIQLIVSAYLARAISGGEQGEARAVALVIGPIYVALHLLTGLASRQAHRMEHLRLGEYAAPQLLWLLTVAIYATLVLTAIAQDHLV